MYVNNIRNSFRKIITIISDKYKINKEELLKQYLNEYSNNMLLKPYKYNDYNLLKDCFNNLYLTNKETNILELIGYISNNEIIFDKTVKKTITKKGTKIKKINCWDLGFDI